MCHYGAIDGEFFTYFSSISPVSVTTLNNLLKLAVMIEFYLHKCLR